MSKFKKGQKRSPKAGRRRGSQNRTTGILKEAVLLAAELEGDVSLQQFTTTTALHRESDEAAAKRGGLVGYLRYVAREHPPSFVTLLNRVLPLQVQSRCAKPNRCSHRQRDPGRNGTPRSAVGSRTALANRAATGEAKRRRCRNR